FTNQHTDFQDAEQICQNLGAHLPSIHSDIENLELGTFAYNNLPPSTGFPWLGLYCPYTVNNCTWTDGSAYNYNYTWTSYPSSNNPCVVIRNEESGDWDDRNYWESYICTTGQAVICQKRF
uniref:C-type lectin domain-containing protein n=1 Tax=Acrobeloides nanus TaxID=290746 RepID=A0A914DGQ9_9BILA